MRLLLSDSLSDVFVSDVVFGSVFNESLVHQVFNAYFAGSRQGTCAQKSRAEVSGSGKKPWRQKGTGRARSGSIRSPIWRSGGVTFAAKPVDYRQKVNRKMYRGALRSILSELLRQGRLFFLESFSLKEAKTRCLLEKLQVLGCSMSDGVLILLHEFDKNVILASRNLYKVKVCCLNNLDLCFLINCNKVLMTVQFIKNIEGMLV